MSSVTGLGKGGEAVHEVVVVGAGAAGLMAALCAGRSGGGGRVVAVDGAKKIGAKILVAGGGRCNVTHYEVDEKQYAGTSLHSIRNVLGRLTVAQTVSFFAGLGVELKREETGKLFPVSDDAHTVLDGLLAGVASAGARIVHPWRVARIERAAGGGFMLARAEGKPEGKAEGKAEGEGEERMLARRVVLATGGMALPRTGSDGGGYGMAKSLGHSVTPAVFPALVPLLLDQGGVIGRTLSGLSGLTFAARLEVLSGGGKRLKGFENSTLLTHFGLSGPSVLDVSRYYTLAKMEDAGAKVTLNVVPLVTSERVEEGLLAGGGKAVWRVVAGFGVMERLARGLVVCAGLDEGRVCGELKREERLAVVRAVTGLVLPVVGDRGFTFAEATAGGVPLSEVNIKTMESRACPGLYLCGEVLDVDGRVGGFNFQWAWASGYVAGNAAGSAG